jgi:hypothetical protein
MPKALAKLKSCDPRDIWADEAREFTPWLAERENIVLLGQQVGLELKVHAQEHRVGPFRADILCKDGAGRSVLIENQLSRSDHKHLGQLLTYAATLRSATIIWLARNICKEHRVTLKWLNEITNEQFHFFGVEVEVWSIQSFQAPRFTVVVRPDDSNHTPKKAASDIADSQTESARRRLEFWETFLAALKLDEPEVKVPKPNTLGNLWFNLHGHDLWITVYSSTSLSRIGVFLRGRAEFYDKLFRRRQAINKQLGEPVSWQRETGGDYWAIAVSRRADPANRNEWPQQHRWLAQRLKKFIRVFKPIFPELK